MNFKEWYNQADMPEIVDGVWVDLETGIPFGGFAKPKRTMVEIQHAASKKPMRKAEREEALARMEVLKGRLVGIVTEKYGKYEHIKNAIDALVIEIENIKPTKFTREYFVELQEANAEIGRMANKAREEAGK